jgi:3-isopropylmalate/(R)-2-methylmalate dehydratase small subunit
MEQHSDPPTRPSGLQFTTLTSRVVPLPVDNIDTDQIIPARFLKVIDKQGLAQNLFADWRQDPGFVLNQPEVKGARILLAGDNFGCGSSREHAPWALTGWGFAAVISTSFADIFRGNALKNGLLPVTLPARVVQRLFDARADDPELKITVDLESQQVLLVDGTKVGFEVDAFARHCLLAGVDQLGYLLDLEDRIVAFESRREKAGQGFAGISIRHLEVEGGSGR